MSTSSGVERAVTSLAPLLTTTAPKSSGPDDETAVEDAQAGRRAVAHLGAHALGGGSRDLGTDVHSEAGGVGEGADIPGHRDVGAGAHDAVPGVRRGRARGQVEEAAEPGGRGAAVLSEEAHRRAQPQVPEGGRVRRRLHEIGADDGRGPGLVRVEREIERRAAPGRPARPTRRNGRPSSADDGRRRDAAALDDERVVREGAHEAGGRPHLAAQIERVGGEPVAAALRGLEAVEQIPLRAREPRGERGRHPERETRTGPKAHAPSAYQRRAKTAR